MSHGYEFVVPAAFALLAALGTLAGVLLYRRYPMRTIYRSKQHLETAFDSFADPLAVIDDDYRIVRANRAYTTLVGKSYASVVGQRCYEVLRNRDAACDDCRKPETIAENKRTTVELSPCPRNSEGAISLTFFPFVSSYGGSAGPAVVEHIRDLTELQRLRLDLEKKNAQLMTATSSLKRAHASLADEMAMAREVQNSIFPREIPKISGLKIAAYYKPVESVGGDLYDIIPFSSSRVGVFVGDASGHGLPAAFVSTIAKMALYNRVRDGVSPSEVLMSINHDLVTIVESAHYLTGFWGEFDAERRTVRFARGGHPRPIVIPRKGEPRQLDSSGTILGVTEAFPFEEKQETCSPGDRIFIFTDGVYMGSAEDRGTPPARDNEWFAELLVSCNSEPFHRIIPTIQERLSAYACEDDYTVLAIEMADENTAADE